MEKPNIEYIVKLAGNEESVRLKLIRVLKYELPIEIEAYSASIALNNWQQAAFYVHKIKHKVAILGLTRTYHMSEKYEIQLSDNRRELQKDFENALSVMQNFVNNL